MSPHQWTLAVDPPYHEPPGYYRRVLREMEPPQESRQTRLSRSRVTLMMRNTRHISQVLNNIKSRARAMKEKLRVGWVAENMMYTAIMQGYKPLLMKFKACRMAQYPDHVLTPEEEDRYLLTRQEYLRMRELQFLANEMERRLRSRRHNCGPIIALDQRLAGLTQNLHDYHHGRQGEVEDVDAAALDVLREEVEDLGLDVRQLQNYWELEESEGDKENVTPRSAQRAD